MKYLFALIATFALAACTSTESTSTQSVQRKDAAAVANATQGINEM